jgi:small subunit ribosomal protein S25e
MGTKGKKPLSSIEKRQRRLMGEESRSERRGRRSGGRESRGSVASSTSVKVDHSIYRRIKNEIANIDVITPYVVASRFDITLTAAKSVLRLLESEGVVRLYDKSRRLSIYLPVRSGGGTSAS